LVKWDGYSHEENTWETYDNVAECSFELLKSYYNKNPMVERDGRYERKKR
jgi:hypothetical protein